MPATRRGVGGRRPDDRSRRGPGQLPAPEGAAGRRRLRRRRQGRRIWARGRSDRRGAAARGLRHVLRRAGRGRHRAQAGPRRGSFHFHPERRSARRGGSLCGSRFDAGAQQRGAGRRMAADSAAAGTAVEGGTAGGQRHGAARHDGRRGGATGRRQTRPRRDRRRPGDEPSRLRRRAGPSGEQGTASRIQAAQRHAAGSACLASQFFRHLPGRRLAVRSRPTGRRPLRHQSDAGSRKSHARRRAARRQGHPDAGGPCRGRRRLRPRLPDRRSAAHRHHIAGLCGRLAAA